MKKDNQLSKCCNAKVKLGGTPDFIGSDEICTVYNVCTKCGQPCDIKKVKTKK